jgi:hypothetical protein
VGSDLPTSVKLAAIFLVCSVASLIWILLMEGAELSYDVESGILNIFTGGHVGSFVLLGTVCAYGNFMLQDFLTKIFDAFIMDTCFLFEIVLTQIFLYCNNLNSSISLF